MKIKWSKNAERNLDRIFEHAVQHFSHAVAKKVYQEIEFTLFKLEKFPELGRRVGGHGGKRSLPASGNVILYEIVLRAEPYILIRDIRPRKTS